MPEAVASNSTVVPKIKNEFKDAEGICNAICALEERLSAFSTMLEAFLALKVVYSQGYGGLIRNEVDFLRRIRVSVAIETGKVSAQEASE